MARTSALGARMVFFGAYMDGVLEYLRRDLTRDEAGMYRWDALDGVGKSLYHTP